jgi:hypothetical protein
MPKRRSPDAPPIVKIERDQSKIAKQWWTKKRKDQKAEKQLLENEIAALQAEKDRLVQEIKALAETNVSISESLKASERKVEAAEPLLKELDGFGGLKKSATKPR